MHVYTPVRQAVVAAHIITSSLVMELGMANYVNTSYYYCYYMHHYTYVLTSSFPCVQLHWSTPCSSS